MVGLQKIRVPDEEFPTRILESSGYHATAYCRKGEYGVGILSRRKPTVVRKGLPGQDDLVARLLTVVVDGLELSSVYAPYGNVEGRARKLAWLKSLREHVAATHPRSARHVLCGDFNVVPEDRDSLRYGVRLDLILGTKRIVDRVRDIRVDMDYRKPIDGLIPSECAPVIAELDD